ncbi:MAG TPA: NUDIX domain-containing protein [Acidimicrobiia bacterium]|nr:NUDIX domain-containing protein [Acidimicrobiia bacterium]
MRAAGDENGFMVGVSAGLMLYRIREGAVEVLLVHPGGPFWRNRSDGAWSIPKGEFDPASETALEAASREFREEIGHAPPAGVVIDLGEVVQKAGKRVIAFAVEGDIDPQSIISNTFPMEWPPGSGRIAEFPEVDRAEWLPLAAACTAINPAQVPLLDRLAGSLDA